jgi:hypothetical protein
MIYRIAARIAALSQPLSERRDYGTSPEDSLPNGEEPECHNREKREAEDPDKSCLIDFLS